MTKIVSITGAELPQPDTADPKVVELLERWLKLAKDGELKGVSLCAQHQNGDAGTAFAGTISIQMLGSLHLLLHRITLLLTEEDKEVD